MLTTSQQTVWTYLLLGQYEKAASVSIDEVGERGDTLLMLEQEDVRVTRFLLEHGVDADLQDREGFTALMVVAGMFEFVDVTDIFLEIAVHSNIELENNQGETVMDILRRYELPPLIQKWVQEKNELNHL